MLTIPPSGPVPTGPLLIGDVAELTGLSLRSIRHYEELGLVAAETWTTGGFRVFGAEAVERLRLVMMLRVMDLSLEEILPIVNACRVAEIDGAGAPEQLALQEAQTKVAEGLAALEARVDLAKDLAQRLRAAADMTTPAGTAVE